MLREFASWWARQMLALSPVRALADTNPQNAVLISLGEASGAPQLRIASRRRRREAFAESFPMDEAGLRAAARMLRRCGRASVVVSLGPGILLEREVALPLAAEPDMHRVLGYEMDRLTPFTADEVYWGAAVQRRDRNRGRLELRLSLVPKATVAPLIAALSRLGTEPVAIEAAADRCATRRIALNQAAARSRRRPLAIVAAAVGALGVAAAVIPFVTQSLALAAVEHRIAAAQPAVSEVEALRRRIASGSAGADVIVAERARTGDALQVLATVTDLMPDDTVLSEFTLRQGRLGISGQSRAAARLIPVLAADPLIRNPSFAAPVTRAPVAAVQGGRGNGEQSDLFSIRAELNP